MTLLQDVEVTETEAVSVVQHWLKKVSFLWDSG